MIGIDAAIRDDKLLGAGLGSAETWGTWLAVLRAAFGLHLSRKERRAFDSVARRSPPRQRVRELWAIVGRRSGKSRMAAALAVFFALFLPHQLAAGEVGSVLVLAASRDQAKVVFRYAVGFIQASPVLAKGVASVTADEIRLKSGIVIGVHPASFRTVRGRTILACVFDEVAFWRDENSAEPDLEIYRAVLPSLASSGGMLVGISSPYRKVGLLHTKYRDHFGVDDPSVMIVQGESRQFNSTLDAGTIDAARADDPESAQAEWDGQFRGDLSSYLTDELIEAAIDHSRPLELPPRSGITYSAFCDPSGGRHDSFTICVGHREGERFIADVVRGKRPPFDPAQVVTEFAQLVRADYRCRSIHGDNYSAEWAASAFTNAGVKFQRSDKSKSELYLEAIPSFTRGLINIPAHPQLVRELRLLERRTSRIGRDLVDHGKSGSDDYPNSLVGALRLSGVRRFASHAQPVGGCY
jgi:hypothetical protein